MTSLAWIHPQNRFRYRVNKLLTPTESLPYPRIKRIHTSRPNFRVRFQILVMNMARLSGAEGTHLSGELSAPLSSTRTLSLPHKSSRFHRHYLPYQKPTNPRATPAG